MNKKKEVLLAEYNEESKFFDKIYEVYDINYAPYILKSFYKEDEINDTPFRTNLSEWFRGRGIPSWRDRLDLLLHRLNINAPSELLDKAFGLSLSDQYWLKPYNTKINYDDINFFDNDFDYSEFLEASLSKNSKTIMSENSLKTPNNTTDGMLKKAWIIENGTRYLLKGGYKNELLQPFNEVLASEICKRLGFNHVTYTLDTYKDTVVSICPCFITKDTELITCYQIRNDMLRNDNIKDYEEYINILEEHGISDARIKMENMYIIDYLIMNEDRHLNNFGIIRDVNTLKWLDVAPIFDNGQSLNITYYDNEELHISGEGRLFYEVKPFDEIIKVVKDIKRIDLSKLDGIVEWFDELLHKYQNLTGFSDTRINRLCILLNRQINKLKELQENS
ncbi:MAG TPA: HipA domain-containing protein [Candidatus Onthocola stercorigallinarum]|nr:HipA domain-containing protein [Candidatus Onthocola stercorigallinarum]